MRKTGKKHRDGKIVFYKRGECPSPLFFLFLLSLPIYLSGQYYSSKLFPERLRLDYEKVTNNGQLISYSINSFYDNTYKRSRNDTTLTDIHRTSLHQIFYFPIDSNTALQIDHRYIDYHVGYQDPPTKQILNSTRENNILSVGYRKKQKWFNFDFFYSYGLDQPYKNIHSSFSLHFKNFFVQPEYYSITKERSGYFNSDTINYVAKTYTMSDSRGLMLGYLGKRLSFKYRKLIQYENINDADYPDGLLLNLGASGIQYDSELRYEIGDYSLWGTIYHTMDTSDVPIYWKDSKLGQFTAIDDTLYSIKFGISSPSHELAFGSGYWLGKIWISQFSPHPFAPVWAILSGTKYYLDSRYNLEFASISYQFDWQSNRYNAIFNLNLLHFEGSLFGEQWVLAWPVELLNNRTEIEIKELDLIENHIKLSKKINNRIKLSVWSNIFLPINLKIEVTPDLPDDDPVDPDPEPTAKEKISGGLQLGIELRYLFK